MGDTYKPSKSSESAIEKMMNKWREDDRKLEMDERDRAKRSMAMKKIGLVLLRDEDERVGVTVAATPTLPPPQKEEHTHPSTKSHTKNTTPPNDSGEEKQSSTPYTHVDPSLYEDNVIHRTPPLGLTSRLRPNQLIVRDLTKEELSMAFAWMFQDEQDYAGNPNQWWTRARKGFMVGWEDGEDRLTGGFIEGIAFPVAFCITKTDHRLEIDAIGVRRCMRGLGIASIYVNHYLRLAEGGLQMSRFFRE
jgi:GNAT superfamily N-acetyltransferase